MELLMLSSQEELMMQFVVYTKNSSKVVVDENGDVHDYDYDSEVELGKIGVSDLKDNINPQSVREKVEKTLYPRHLEIRPNTYISLEQFIINT